MQGDWAGLFTSALDDAHQTAQSQPRPRRVSRREPRPQRLLHRSMDLFYRGAASRACQALEATDLAPATAETLAALRNKHPPAEIAMGPRLEVPTGAKPLPAVTKDALRQALLHTPRGAAGGPSGWLLEHLRDLCCADEDMLLHLAAVMGRLQQGEVAPPARDLLASSRLVALAKGAAGYAP